MPRDSRVPLLPPRPFNVCAPGPRRDRRGREQFIRCSNGTFITVRQNGPRHVEVSATWGERTNLMGYRLLSEHDWRRQEGRERQREVRKAEQIVARARRDTELKLYRQRPRDVRHEVEEGMRNNQQVRWDVAR